MVLSTDVLTAAVLGLLVEEGHDFVIAKSDVERFGLGPHAPQYITKAIRKVSSVALTFQAHGIMKETTN